MVGLVLLDGSNSGIFWFRCEYLSFVGWTGRTRFLRWITCVRKDIIVNGGPLCLLAEESVNHLFIHCCFAYKFGQRFSNSLVYVGSCQVLLESRVTSGGSRVIWDGKGLCGLSFFAGFWKIWLERNNRVFVNKIAAVVVVVDSIVRMVSVWTF